MGRARKGWVRLKGSTWYVGLTLRSGRSFERQVPAPSDGLPIDANYLALVRSELVREYISGAWDPEAPEPSAAPASPVPEIPTFISFVRRFAGSRSYESAAKDRRRVECYLADCPLAELPVPELRSNHGPLLVNHLRALPSRRGGKLGASAVRSIFDVCQRALDEAVEDGLLSVNPFRSPRSRNALPEKEHKDPGALARWCYSRRDVERLIADPRVGPDRRVLYALLFLTGMRPGELGALRFGDWDRSVSPLTRITIAVAVKSVSKAEGKTKTRAIKQVPVHPTLAAILGDWEARGWEEHMGRAPRPGDYVVPSTRGRRKGQPRNGSTTTRTFHADCEALGLPSLHLYCARHTFITLTQEDDGDGMVLRWITHAPPKTAYDGYTRQNWKSLCRELIKLQIALLASTDVAEASIGPEATAPTAADTLADSLDRSADLAANAVEQAPTGGSTEESNLPRGAKGTVATSFEDWARHQTRSCFRRAP